jgi:hypothetical protein
MIERRKANRDCEHDEFPIGTPVVTALGLDAVVIGYRGFKLASRTGRRMWLVCRYLNPPNKRHDKVLLLPELVTKVPPR